MQVRGLAGGAFSIRPKNVQICLTAPDCLKHSDGKKKVNETDVDFMTENDVINAVLSLIHIKDILVSKFSKDVLSNICLFMAGLLYLVFCFNVPLHVLSILNRCMAPMNLTINLF